MPPPDAPGDDPATGPDRSAEATDEIATDDQWDEWAHQTRPASTAAERGFSPPDGGSDQTVEQAAWNPWAAAREAPPAERTTQMPALGDPHRWPAPPPPPGAQERKQRRSALRRAAIAGGLAGALLSAVVATGVTVALDDDEPSSSRSPATPVTSSDGSLDIQAILTQVQPSVVAIETSTNTSRGVFEGAGSGIVMSEDGLILTNAHVIGGLSDITVVLADGSQRDAALVGSSPDDDLAVIQAQGVSDLVPARLGSSQELRVGDEVIAIGNALNLGSEPTVTRGIVSATDRNLTAEGIQLNGLIQTDAAINPGNSGGPLVNAAGEVVGVNTAIVADAQNLGFSIAIDQARPIIEQLRSGGGAINPNQAFLGVSSRSVDDLTDTVRARFEVVVEAGAFIDDVVPDSSADRAGLQVGDVIVEMDGTRIEGPTDVRDIVLGHEPGEVLQLVVVREGQEQPIEVELGRRGDGG